MQFKGHAPALGFLRLHHAARQGPQLFLGPPGLRHVGHHHADGRVGETILCQWTNGDLRRYFRTVAGVKEHLDLGAGFVGPFQERSERCAVRSGEKAAKGTAYHLLQRAFDHPGEALVGVKNHLVSRNRQRPFVHGFDEHAVGMLGALQREHL